MTTLTYTLMPSPIGELLLAGDDRALHEVHLEPRPRAGWRRGETPPLAEARAQLERYFAGELTEFDLPLTMNGTEFQRDVWTALRDIPFGETTSYGVVGATIGHRNPRAIGAANGSNPIPIIVPCHRVIGADGSLVGYGGGLDRKRWLLEHERSRVQLGLFA